MAVIVVPGANSVLLYLLMTLLLPPPHDGKLQHELQSFAGEILSCLVGITVECWEWRVYTFLAGQIGSYSGQTVSHQIYFPDTLTWAGAT